MSLSVAALRAALVAARVRAGRVVALLSQEVA
jgi:hypothetical protein